MRRRSLGALSGDAARQRLRRDADRARWYPATASLPAGVVYGLSERHADAIRDARLVSCPGCYPTAALLAIEPLADAGLVQGAVVVDAAPGKLATELVDTYLELKASGRL